MAGSANKLFEVQEGKLVRTRRQCPKCGVGVFMARHEDRQSCGRCGHTEYTKAGA